MALSNFAVRGTGVLLLSLGVCVPAVRVRAADVAVSADDIVALKQAIEQLQAENRNLTRRLNALEAETGKHKPVTQKSAKARPPPERAQQAERPQPPPQHQQAAAAPPAAQTNASLEERVTELELAKAAQESATRSIIQSALSGMGPKINEFVSLGGSLEVTAGRASDFSGTTTDQIAVSTAELDLEVRANDWMVGNLTLAFENGTGALFPTNPSFSAQGVDRFTLDKGYITIGDTQRFPLFARAGLDYLEFGLSTGAVRNDILSIVNPLTIEAFQARKPMVGIGFGLPTPIPAPPTPPIAAPQVRPLVLNPLVGMLARSLGYQPSLRPKPINTYTPAPEPPPFFGFVSVYDSSAPDVPNRAVTGNINARLGYRTGGHCGRPYSELKSSFVCPWGLELTLDYDSSVFDSLFLQSEYLPFLGQIGRIPGLAGTAKLNFGPFLLIGEWTSAIQAAKFVDDAGNNINMTPSSWQVALGYQFDWNPWVESIGAQGDYAAIGYSQTSDLAGVEQLVGATPTRVGFLPRSRLTVTAGEWFLENAKLAIEYSHNWDYSVSKGGTGKQADGVFGAITYNW